MMYKLRAELRAHEADVRGVAVSKGGDLIATASRDKTIGIWRIGSHNAERILRGHTHFVNDVSFIDADTLVSASNDKTIRVWNAQTGECLRTLEGHSASVCAISLLPVTPGSSSAPQRLLLSASWDFTARVWDIDSGQCIRVLQGHTAAVWNAKGLPDGRIVTVAADKQVRLWNGNQSIVLPAIHTDVVRDVALCNPTSDLLFSTIANDSRLIAWDRNLTPLLTQPDVHDGSYIYSMDVHSSDDEVTFVTGGEDNAVRFTKLSITANSIQPGQAIVHPGTVWSVAISPDAENIVSGCSDGVARIFTRDLNAVADPDVLEAFEKSVAERKVNTRVIGGVDVSKLPDVQDGLSKPGTKDGENRIVRTSNGKAEVHLWSASEQKWTKIGDVVDGPDGGASLGAGNVRGKKYDFVFEVEIGEGGKKEKLGYNRGENPYLAAQRFIDDNELSPEFLDQIAKFIEQQVPPEALVAGPGSAPSDPLTGGSRYVPGGSGGSNAAAGGDPLTGGSRYVPGGTGGHSSANGTSANPALPPPRKLIPHADGMISYRNSDQLDKIQQKLSAANTELAKAGDANALNMDEAKIFGQSLMPKLKSRSGSDLVLDDAECMVVEKMLTKWPDSAPIFAVLDIARLVIVTPSGGAYFFGRQNGLLMSHVFRHMNNPNAAAAIHMMGCRFLCNLFGNRVVGAYVREQMSTILDQTQLSRTHSNRRARETFAALLINYALMLHDAKANVEQRLVIAQMAIKLVNDGEKDEEVLYRLMICLGTVMCDDPDTAKQSVEIGAAQAAADCAPLSPRLQQVALEIATLIAT